MSKTGRATGEHSVGSIFTFALVGLFAVLALLLAVIGVRAYQSAVNTTDLNNQVRASISYVANKVRGGDNSGEIGIEQINGSSMLVLRQEIDGEKYATYIFYHDGALREAFMDAADEFDPEYSEKLVDASAFYVERLDYGLIHMNVSTIDGEDYWLHMAIRNEL